MSYIDELVEVGDMAEDFAKSIYMEYGDKSPVFACSFIRELGVLLGGDPTLFTKTLCQIVEEVEKEEKAHENN